MHKYDTLYIRWKKYKIKKRVKIFFVLAVLFALGYESYTKNLFSKIFPPSPTHIVTKKVLPQQKIATKEIKKVIPTKNIKEKKRSSAIKVDQQSTNMIYPSFDFEKNLFVAKNTHKSTPIKATYKKPPISKKPLIISHTKSLASLKKEFKTKRSSDLALLIAKRYYAKKDYKNTIVWSLLANDIDPSNEESWLLFAKAKYKLGEKNAAMRALQSFINLYNSKQAKTLLREFQSGEFQ